eukprot:1410357-Rhodomonas_salina.1
MQDDDIKRVGSFRRTSFRAYLAAKADQEHIEERTRGGPAMAAVCWVDTMTRLSPEQAVIHWDKFKQKTHFLAQICMCATQTTSCTNSINYLDACSIQARLFDTMYGNGIPPDDFTSSLMGVHTILPLPSNIVIMEGNHDLLREPISFTKNFPAFAGLMFPKYDTINLGIGFLPPPNNFSEMGSIWHFPPARAQITMEDRRVGGPPSLSSASPNPVNECIRPDTIYARQLADNDPRALQRVEDYLNATSGVCFEQIANGSIPIPPAADSSAMQLDPADPDFSLGCNHQDFLCNSSSDSEPEDNDDDDDVCNCPLGNTRAEPGRVHFTWHPLQLPVPDLDPDAISMRADPSLLFANSDIHARPEQRASVNCTVSLTVPDMDPDAISMRADPSLLFANSDIHARHEQRAFVNCTVSLTSPDSDPNVVSMRADPSLLFARSDILDRSFTSPVTRQINTAETPVVSTASRARQTDSLTFQRCSDSFPWPTLHDTNNCALTFQLSHARVRRTVHFKSSKSDLHSTRSSQCKSRAQRRRLRKQRLRRMSLGLEQSHITTKPDDDDDDVDCPHINTSSSPPTTGSSAAPRVFSNADTRPAQREDATRSPLTDSAEPSLLAPAPAATQFSRESLTSASGTREATPSSCNDPYNDPTNTCSESATWSQTQREFYASTQVYSKFSLIGMLIKAGQRQGMPNKPHRAYAERVSHQAGNII